ncbi:MAG: LysR family transcriptional regulator [Burkholderiales bacterium]|nr:LysR family transcriptional regulator [Burkholderiales bacterium]MDE2397413.1 LysR family transcriptional regulator [Burkholderiales bacterium]
MDPLLKLRQLQHLVLLAEELHFSRAAERAFLTQSAFSRSIAALEESASVRLFDRGTRFVRPTPAGRRVIAKARQLLSSSLDLNQELAMLRSGDLGDVAVGTGPFSGIALLPEPVKAMRIQHPSVRVRLEVNHWRGLRDQLDEEKLDFFVSDSRDMPPSDRYLTEPAGEMRCALYARAGHPLAGRDGLRIADLSGFGIASVSMPASLQLSLGQIIAADSEGLLPVSFTCDNVDMLREHCLHTDDLLLAPDRLMQRDVDAARMQRLALVELDAPARRSTLVTRFALTRLRARTPTPAASLLMDMLKTQAVELTPAAGRPRARERKMNRI